jgi:hypothetical protein
VWQLSDNLSPSAPHELSNSFEPSLPLESGVMNGTEALNETEALNITEVFNFTGVFNPSQTLEREESGLSAALIAAIAGGTVGCVALVVLVIAGLFVAQRCWVCSRKDDTAQGESDADGGQPGERQSLSRPLGALDT